MTTPTTARPSIADGKAPAVDLAVQLGRLRLPNPVQLGAVNFYRLGVGMEVLDALPGALAEIAAKGITEIIGSLSECKRVVS